MCNHSTATPERHYWKCVSCLLPMVVEGRKQEPAEACGCCGRHHWRYMGKVIRDTLHVERVDYSTTLTADGTRPCNEVCASATGPVCTCRCGGHNHGSGMVSHPTILADTGQRVRAMPQKQATQDKARAKALVHEQRQAELLDKLEVLREAQKARYSWPRTGDLVAKIRKFNESLTWAARDKYHALALKVFERLMAKATAQPERQTEPAPKPKGIPARYAGWCPLHKRRYEVGEQIYHDTMLGKWCLVSD